MDGETMEQQQKNTAIRNAILLGVLCSVSYLAVYLARNVLGAVSPQMIELGVMTNDQVGTLSSVYFITYAFGQLINGTIGDRIKAKYMLSVGLLMAGVCNILFALLSHYPAATYVSYAMTGFFLAMIYGPMTKLVAENTEPIYATRCSLGYTFASFFGSPLAGILAVGMRWENVFIVSSIGLAVMATACFVLLSLFEKRGIVKYGRYKPPAKRSGGIKILIKHRIIKFTLISMLTGVVRTTVVFWLPTYLAQHLKFSSDKAALLFTVATLVISASSFISVFVYELLHRNMNLTILLAFSVSAFSFLMVYFLSAPAWNISFMVLGIMSSNAAATMLWSRYCPSLRDTGMVSGATGFLDFVSYMAASVSSKLFANATATIGWSGLILTWLALMVTGVIVALPYRRARQEA